MATTQNDNRAKFLELRKQGISVADARNQTYGPAPVVADATPSDTTPVTPVAPVVAPLNTSPESATKSTNIAQREANIASRQATPVATPTPTVATPAPVEATVTPAPTTPTQTPFQQAQAESEKIKAQNEAQMKLNTQQADLKAQERQQVAQETAKANIPVNQKDVLNALVSGVSVAPQNTAAYRNAQMQYKTYQKFSTMTPTQLVDNMKMGEIGTETAQLLASNPNYIKAKEDFDKFQKNQSINNMIKSVAEGATGKTTSVDHYQNASDAIAKKLGITETNADAFARIVSQDPETLQLTKTVSNIAKQLNTLNTERNAVYEDLKKQYPDLSASAIMTLMAGRTKEATAQIDALNSSLTLTQADLKTAMEMAKAEYDATKEDITLQAGLAKEDRAMQNALDLSQAQFDQKLAQQAQLTNDPTTAIGGVIKQFADLGIVGDRDLAWHVAEQKRLGMTLPEYTKKMIEDFKAKPEYQQALAKKANEGVSFQTIGDKVYKVQNGQLVDTGISATKAPEAKAPEWKQDASGNWYNANSATSPEIQAGTLSPTSIAQYSTRLKGNNVQCGMVSNDYAAVKFPDAPRMGDSYESKIKTINSIGQAPIPQVGGLFVMDTGTSTGHTGIVTAVNGDGTFTATDANKSGSKDGGPLQTSTYKISDKVSFSNAPTGTQATPTDTKSTQNLSLYRTYVEDGKLPSKDALKGMNMTSQQFIDNADSGYDAFLKTKAKEISDTYPTLDIEYTGNYAGNSATQKEKLNESVTKIGDIDSRISQLKSLFEKNGTEVWPTADKSVMESLRKQIILKAKEVENLGVLNGPDLGILEDLLPSTTGVMSGLFSFDSNTMAKLNNIQNNYRMDAKTKAINYGAKIDFKGDQPTQSQSNTAPFTMDTLDNEWLNFKP